MLPVAPPASGAAPGTQEVENKSLWCTLGVVVWGKSKTAQGPIPTGPVVWSDEEASTGVAFPAQ